MQNDLLQMRQANGVSLGSCLVAKGALQSAGIKSAPNSILPSLWAENDESQAVDEESHECSACSGFWWG